MEIKKIHTVEIGNPDRVSILLVGCGGSGSYAALHLAQLAYSAELTIELVFIDPDTVEQKNIGRQNFCPGEIGQPKAVTLARRYSLAYGLSITPILGNFEDAMIDDYGHNGYYGDNGLTLIVGCVDNAAGRRDIHRAMAKRSGRRNLWWLDAGNDHAHGQVLLGNNLWSRPLITKLGVCFALPLPSVQEPDLLKDEQPDPEASAEGCAELVQLGVQARTINKMMASWIDVYCEQLLVSRDLRMMGTYLDQRSGQAYSEPIAGGQVVEDANIRNSFADLGYQPVQLGSVNPCPQCGSPLIPGRDIVETEVIGDEPGEEREVEIYFCEVCSWRMEQDEYHDSLEVAV